MNAAPQPVDAKPSSREATFGGHSADRDRRDQHAEYSAGHIAGARSIPHDQLADRLAELPRGVEVVAYCRGPFCVYADDAVRLRSRRRRARRLRDGYPEWRRATLPVPIEP